MGASESKVCNKEEKEVPSSPKSLPSTPIQCTKLSNLKNISDLDPRSPSDNVIRTPIEIKSKLTSRSADKNFISSLIHAIDPRSPSDQFQRTPLIIPGKNSEHPSKLHNKILDNVKRSSLYTPTSSNIQKEHNRSVITPPKLLESSPISNKNREKRKSFVGLLETNIDYTETDLDNYIKTKVLNSNLMINVNENDSFSGSIIKCENCDPRSPSTDFLRTPIHIVTKVGEIDLNNSITADLVLGDEIHDGSNTGSLLKIADINLSSNVGLADDEEEECADKLATILQDEAIFTEIVPEQIQITNEQDDIRLNDDSLSVKNKSVSIEEIKEEIQDAVEDAEHTSFKITPVESNNFNRELDIDLTADIQELDRKLTKIIYEDNDTIYSTRTPRKVYDEKPKNRTPMKDRNLIDEPKKSKLRVSDKPKKSAYSVSKIPVFREKNCGKSRVQCENTPPTSMDLRKKKKCQSKWDSDKTLVI